MANGSKFAIVSLTGIHVKDLDGELRLTEGLRAQRHPPYPLDDHWKEWLGSLFATRYEESTLHIVADVPSEVPAILDAEHKHAHRQAFEVYWCLMLVNFLRLTHDPISIRGSVLPDGTTEVRSVGNEIQPAVMQGTPFPTWRVEDLEAALQLKKRVEKLTVFPRFRRITEAFDAGIKATHPDFRLHQFVRAIEGFISAEPGVTTKRFKSRTELFVGPRHHELMGRLYDVRGKIEHLHDPTEWYPGSKFERWLSLWRDSVVAEALARAVIRRFISQEDLWVHFADDDKSRAFWLELSAEERQGLWGDPEDVEEIAESFEGRYLAPEDIGLTEADR